MKHIFRSTNSLKKLKVISFKNIQMSDNSKEIGPSVNSSNYLSLI